MDENELDQSHVILINESFIKIKLKLLFKNINNYIVNIQTVLYMDMFC